MTKPIVLITGAAGGLGRALAFELAQAGTELMLLDKDSRGLDQLYDQLRADHLPEPALCPLDLAHAGPEAYLELASIFEQEFGGLDHVVHCAVHFEGLTPLEQIAPGQWATAMQVNLTAAWALTVSCLPQLKKSPDASVTFLMDDPDRSRAAFWGAYGIAKAAVTSMTEIMRQEWENTGIRVQTFNPGPMRTTFRADAFLAEDPAELPQPASAAALLAQTVLRHKAEGQS